MTTAASKKALKASFKGTPGDFVKEHHVAVRYVEDGATYKEGFAPLRKIGKSLAVKLGGRIFAAKAEDGVAVVEIKTQKPLAYCPKSLSAKTGHRYVDIAATNTLFPSLPPEAVPSQFLTYSQFTGSATKKKTAVKAAPKAKAPASPEAPSLDELVNMLKHDESLKAAFIAKLIA